jgi:putative phosphoribosyl transferase
MHPPFEDRRHAGELLAARLGGFARRPGTVVLALPRGGVPVAAVVAQTLRLPLDVLIVRKLGVPGNEEFALGAIASGGIQVLNEETVAELGVDSATIRRVAEHELQELARRELLYRDGRAAVVVEGRTVILVDDGVATGASIRAGLAALRRRRAARLIVAAPVIAAGAMAGLRGEADEVVAVVEPERFGSVGEWYLDFSQTTDEEVRTLLASAAGI